MHNLVFYLKKGCQVKLLDHLDVRCIASLDVSTRDEAIEKLVDLLLEAKQIKDARHFYKAVLDREKIVSTGIGLGVAIPHAKLKEFDDFFIAIGIQKEKGLDWNSLDNNPVRLIFLIGGPEKRQTDYLQLLSKLTSALKEESLRKALISGNLEKEQVIQLFEKY